MYIFAVLHNKYEQTPLYILYNLFIVIFISSLMHMHNLYKEASN